VGSPMDDPRWRSQMAIPDGDPRWRSQMAIPDGDPRWRSQMEEGRGRPRRTQSCRWSSSCPSSPKSSSAASRKDFDFDLYEYARSSFELRTCSPCVCGGEGGRSSVCTSANHSQITRQSVPITRQSVPITRQSARRITTHSSPAQSKCTSAAHSMCTSAAHSKCTSAAHSMCMWDA
jgi:hypothetical protein